MLRSTYLAATLLLVGSTMWACGGDEATTARSPVERPIPQVNLFLDFDESVGATGSLIPGVDNAGTTLVDIELVTKSGGRILREKGPSGSAGRFPALDGSKAAAIVVREKRPGKLLSPGTRMFSFGADFRLDAESDGLPTDNGDNLVQRGLFDGPAQYKLQLDKGYASCRVAGSTGAVFARASVPVEADEWYRVSCLREGDSVKLSLSQSEEGSWRSLGSWSATGRIGAVLPGRGTPLTVGAKTAPGGAIVRSGPDQFNGAIDNVQYKRY